MFARPSPCVPLGLGVALGLALVASPGCRRPPAALAKPPELGAEQAGADAKHDEDAGEPGARVRSPACAGTLAGDGRVLVDGKPTGLRGPVEPPMRVRSFAWDEASILLAVGSSHPWWPRGGYDEEVRGDILWRVPCARPEDRSVELQIEGAEFGWAALAPDGLALAFTLRGSAAQRFDFAADDFGPLGTAPNIERCWMAEGPVATEEFVVDWVGEDALLVYNGGPCGFEAEFEGRGLVIEDSAGAVTRRPSGYVGPVVADSEGRLWLGNGGLCAEQQTVRDRGAPGLWRSEDRGESWSYLPIAGIDNGVAAIWTAAEDPDRLLVQAACCYRSAADTCGGGELMRSEDGGASWKEVTPAYTHVLDALEVGPQLRVLEMSFDWIEGGPDRGEKSNLRSDDGGRSWSFVAQRAVAATPVLRSVELAGQVFEATPDGLRRRELGKPAGGGVIVLRPGL
jgi:hypothetical protein